MNGLWGRDIELRQRAGILAEGDNRLEVIRQMQGDEVRLTNEAYLDNLNKLYRTSGLPELNQELNGKLGSKWELDRSHPLIRDDLERPVKLGARKAEIDWSAGPENTSDVLAMHGEIIFYRTILERSRTVDNGDDYYADYVNLPTQYQEQGFFCLFMQPRPDEYQTAAPVLSFGDLDTANWESVSQKLMLPILFGSDETLTSRRPDDFDNQAFLASLTARSEGRRFGLLPRIRSPREGVLRQNETVWMDEDKDVVLETVGEAMQQFIDRWYDPTQTKQGFQESIDTELARAQQELVQQPHALTTFDVARAVLRHVTDRSTRVQTPGLINPEPDISWGWGDCQRRIQEFPLYKALTEKLRDEAPEAYYQSLEQGSISLSQFPTDKRIHKKVIDSILERFRYWDGNPQNRGTEIHTGMMREDI